MLSRKRVCSTLSTNRLSSSWKSIFKHIFELKIFSFFYLILFIHASSTETAAKKRLELIKAQGINVLQDLKSKADNTYKEMNDWLGARFLKEMERYAGINVLSSTAKNYFFHKMSKVC